MFTLDLAEIAPFLINVHVFKKKKYREIFNVLGKKWFKLVTLTSML